jgi:hypothetical protein
MMNAALLPRHIRDRLWAEAATIATQIENRIGIPNKITAAYNKFYNIKEEKLKAFKPFGSIGIVETNKNRRIKGKLTDRGKPCMYLGQAENRAGDVYRFLDLETTRTIMSRDVIWLNKLYGEWKNITKINYVKLNSDSDDNEEASDLSSTDEESTTNKSKGKHYADKQNKALEEGREFDQTNNDDVNDDVDVAHLSPEKSKKVKKAMKKLETYYNKEATAIKDRINDEEKK